MNNFSERISRLSEKQRKILALRLKKKEANSAPLYTIKRRTETQTPAPLSFAQQRMWILDQLTPGSSVYTISGGLHLQGELHLSAFTQAFETLLARHESLRTIFLPVDTEVVQIIKPSLDLHLLPEEVHLVDASQREASLQHLIQAEIEQPFNLARGPLFRVRLLRLEEQEHLLLISVHHAVFDGWSLGILIQEFCQLYDAFCRGLASPLPALALHYADYADWQRSATQMARMQEHLAYWRERLAAPVPVLALPTDFPRPAVQTFAGAQYPVMVSGAVSQALLALSRQEGVTLFMTLIAAWTTVLARLSGQDEVLVGTPIANRPRSELEGLIGCFINTLVLRTDLSGNPSFLVLLQRVRQETVQAYEHQEAPFELIVEAVQPERDRSRSPLFQVMLALQNAPQPPLHLPGLTVTPVATASGGARFDLTWIVWESEQGLQGHFEYNTALFGEATMARLAGYLQRLLQGIVQHPSARLLDLPLLTGGEREHIVETWNATHEPKFLGERGLHQLIEEQVAYTPEATALLFGDRRLSYQQLNTRANQQAHFLQQQGVGPDVLVGIFMERSIELVVSLLAVLKAGGAYVPLDPEYPAERLAFLLEDAQVALVLTQEHLLARLPTTYATPLLSFEHISSRLEAGNSANLPCRVHASNLAYMIYTSGSTGTPKGAMNTHGAIVNRLLWMQQAYPLQPDDRVLQKTPFSFDVSVWEFFWPLLSGACLVVSAPGLQRDSAALCRLIEQERITTLHFVPSMLRVFLQESDVEHCHALRRVICSGEALSFDLQERFFARLPLVELHNLYGPTEAAVDVSSWACDRTSTRALVPIGYPIANIQLYVLDAVLQPVPIGVTGELYIAGVGLARGYLRRPERTAEVFVPDPFSAEGSRLYKTGDLARYLPDGALEFLGRSDQQVKLRGFRIEPGEIEAVLNEHPAVRESVVLLRQDHVGDPCLVGYVALDAQQAPVLHRLLRLQREGVIQEQTCTVLPNGLPLVQQNHNETLFTYREIFEQRQYLQGGITLPDDVCVIDVGANIGLFSLFIGQECSQARIYAIEPMPALFAILQSNMRLYDLSARLLPCALAQQAGSEILHYYPHISIMSGRFTNEQQDRELVKAFLLNEQGEQVEASLLEELLEERMQREEVVCPVKTLSQVMREEGLMRVDLLKVDVEKSELAVLEGIEAEDWARIAQIVVEVQDHQGQLERLCSLLKAQGYVLTVEEQDSLSGTGLYLVYARRPESDLVARVPARGPVALPWTSSETVERELRALLGQRLPDYMMPSTLILLDDLPVTANGKLDRQALPLPEQGSRGRKQSYVAPSTPLQERLAQIWQQVLGLERVGVHDHFFDLGGHSLKATQIISRVQQQEKVRIPLHHLFDNPTIAGLADIIEQTLEHGDDADERTTQMIQPEARSPEHVMFPVSFAQQRMWILDQLTPGSPVYTISGGLRLQGILNLAAFTRSFDTIVARHESLRTLFAAIGDELFQVIQPPTSLHLAPEDLSSLEPHHRQTQLERLITDEAQRPFSLISGPLFRVRLFLLEEQEHLVLISVHHAVFDGWSLGILIQEFSQLYGAYCRGLASPLADVSLQYADFAQWQRSAPQLARLQEHLAYWREHLAAPLPILALPTDAPRPAVQTFAGAPYPVTVSAAVTQALHALSRQEGVTLFMTLLAAWTTVLARLSGQDEVLVGTPIANRQRSELEGLIGCLINTLVLRTDLSGNPPFRDLLQRVRQETLRAYEHQETPFEQIVEAVQPERDRSRSALFQVMLALQNAPQPPLHLPGLTVTPVASSTEGARFDLTWIVWESEQGLQGHFEYNTALFEEATMARLVGHLQTLMQGIVASPTARLLDLPLLSEQEREHIVEVWNATDEPELVRECGLHYLIEEQVARTPEATALLFGAQPLSYQQLNARANQLAHALQRRGVGPDVLVGLLMERSVELVVSLLAVLKAGGAYVPLDPEYPAERLAFLLVDAQVALLLTQDHLVARLPPICSVPYLALEQAKELIEQEDTINPERVVHPGNLAYMIYTSGSTGTPKGVMNTHEAIVNRLRWMQEGYQLHAEDRVLQKTPYSFDVSVWEFFWPLLSGACLVVAAPGVQRDSAALCKLIEEARITTVHFVPSMLQVFLQEPAVERCRGLRRVICSGEALSLELQQRFFARLPSVELHNLYGPTEAAVDVSWWACEQETTRALVPIGRPIANIQLYILDAAFQPVPIGVAGDLYIAGVGLARGYLRRPELTAQAFLPNPFSVKGTRLYRTGDRARYLSDGAIEFLGRRDEQVKLRGQRIELGEIEARLNEHPVVQESVVLLRQDRANDTRLVGYVVPDAHTAPILHRLLRMQREGKVKAQAVMTLPNGLPLIQQNPNETQFLYREIFEERQYLQGGVTLPQQGCVVDVGANIGLFSLFVGLQRPGVSLYAIEPMPALQEVLRRNMELYALTAQVLGCALSHKTGQETFHYYPHISILSGRFTDEQQDRELVKAFLLNEQGEQVEASLLEELLEERMQREEVVCPVKTLSQVMREEHIEHIDLLKIDVEKSERAVLEGIEAQDWEKIEQIVLEVQEDQGNGESIRALLSEHGYHLTVQTQSSLTGTGLSLISARRQASETCVREKANEPIQMAWATVEVVSREVQAFVGQSLPAYMVPAALVLLDRLPVTSNGKLDRRALPLPEEDGMRRKQSYVAPRTALEERLVHIWQAVLGVERVGIHESFFALGGHSLLAVQAVSRLREEVHKNVSLNNLFQAPTVAEMAALISSDNLQFSCLQSLKSTGARPPLFCFHPAGGEASIYRLLVTALDEEQPLYCLQSRALSETIGEHNSIEAMAHEYVDAMRKQQPRGPYYLLGWSMGGVIALAAARELEQLNEKVAFIGLLDAHLSANETVSSLQWMNALEGLDLALGGILMQAFSALSQSEQETLQQELLSLPEQEQFQQALHWARQHNILPLNISTEAFASRAALVNMHRELLRHYHAPTVAAPLFVWWAREFPEHLLRTDWRQYSSGKVQEVFVEGNHFSIMKQPHIYGLAKQLEHVLKSFSRGFDSNDPWMI